MTKLMANCSKVHYSIISLHWMVHLHKQPISVAGTLLGDSGSALSGDYSVLYFGFIEDFLR